MRRHGTDGIYRAPEGMGGNMGRSSSLSCRMGGIRRSRHLRILCRGMSAERRPADIRHPEDPRCRPFPAGRNCDPWPGVPGNRLLEEGQDPPGAAGSPQGKHPPVRPEGPVIDRFRERPAKDSGNLPADIVQEGARPHNLGFPGHNHGTGPGTARD